MHEYVETSTGQAQSSAPPETCSLCELFAADLATAGLTGKPTAFFSHAWKFSFSKLVATMEAFQAAQPEDEPEVISWIQGPARGCGSAQGGSRAAAGITKIEANPGIFGGFPPKKAFKKKQKNGKG